MFVMLTILFWVQCLNNIAVALEGKKGRKKQRGREVEGISLKIRANYHEQSREKLERESH